LAALCQFTLSGPPIVYYGTEVGLSQERDVVQGQRHVLEESRQPMRWGARQDRGLHRFYKELIQLRRTHPVLWRGAHRTLLVDDEAGVYVYERSDDQDRIITALNLSDHPRRF